MDTEHILIGIPTGNLKNLLPKYIANVHFLLTVSIIDKKDGVTMRSTLGKLGDTPLSILKGIMTV